MAMDVKEIVVPVAHPVVPLTHSAIWQTEMHAAFAVFLTGVKEQLVDVGHVRPRPIVLSYESSLSQTAEPLAQYLIAAGLSVILNPINMNAPQAQIAVLKKQLDADPQTQVIVLSTPAYAALANQDDQRLHHILENFGTGKKDTLLPLMCEGGFKVASQIVPGHFLFRNYEPALRAFDGPQGGMPAFLDMFGEVSGSSGLGLLPDLLDLESTNAQHKPIYATLFTAFSQVQARLTTDYVLEENLDTQLATHSLRGHYEPAQGLQVADEEKHNDVSERLIDFLIDPKAKTALLLAPTLADAELSSLAVVEILRQEHSHPRVIAIDLAQYPGRAAHQCLALTLRHTLKLASPIIQQLRQHTLGEHPARPTVLVLKNYQHTGSYDNLYIKNNLANWPDLKVVVTCTGDYFNRHDPKVCFLSDPTSPDASSLQQINLAGFATQAAQAAVMGLRHMPLENLDELLADSGLTPKRQAQQVELDRFLNQIAPLANIFPVDARNAFISYAWEPNKNDLARQQRHLRQIVQDLGRVGFLTWLDIERMTGDINAQMAQNIQSSRYVLLIGTPRYTQRATVLLNGQPTNVKREYDDILQGHQAGKLEVLALSFLPEGPFDGEQSAYYPSFPETLPPSLPRFDISGVDDFDIYIRRLTDEEDGLLPQLLHLAERSPEDQQAYRAAKTALTDALDLLPAQHLVVAQAEQDQRIYEVPQRRSLYIEARGKAEHKNESPEFGLTAQFEAFLSMAEDSKVEESKDDMVISAQVTTFVVLGEGGSGKSLFSQIQYARLLEAWQKHKTDPATHPRPAWIPIYIPLKQYVGKHESTGQARVNTCVETALREVYHLDDRDITVLKTGSGQGQKLGVLLILDGFDELGGETPHLYRLNHLDQWTCPLKLLITSRVDYISDPDQHKQYFETQACGFVRSYIQPFSSEDIQRYIRLYEAQVLIQQSQAQAARDVAAGVLTPAAPQPHADTYQTLETLPGLLELVKNPFLLNLVLQGLPYLLAERKVDDQRPVTRLAIYDSFSQYWFGKEVYRLVKQDDPELRLRLEQHAERLAFELHLNRQLSVSQKRPEDVELWKAFFDTGHPQVAKARAALPLRDVGNQQYEFMHKTLFEYFVTRHLVNAYHRALPDQPHPNPVALSEALAAHPPEHKVQRVAGVPLPVQDAGVFGFLKDAIEANEDEGSFKAALFEQVKRSASPQGQAEPKTGGPLGLAAAHAVTILTKTGTSMANQVWPGVQLPGADLGLACLANVDLSGANLRGANLAGTFLYGANLQCANLADVRFMEYPSIEVDYIDCLAVYPSRTAQEDRPWIVVGCHRGEVNIVDRTTSTWAYSGETTFQTVKCVAFHPAGDLVVSGSVDKKLRFWQVGKTLRGHPMLKRHTMLKHHGGHDSAVTACAFNTTGDLLVSGSSDGTLLFWQIRKESGGELWVQAQAVLRGHDSGVTACAFNPAGNLVVSASDDETLRLWPVGKKSNGELQAQAVLRGHDDGVTSCAFSPMGDLLVSGSRDETLRLWQVGKKSHGELQAQAVLRGHESGVTACAFNPNGDLVVSGSEDKTLRLWQVGKKSKGELQAKVVLQGHENRVNACAFSSTGDLVVSGGEDRKLRFWQVAKESFGDLVLYGMLRGHDGGVTSCAFSPMGDLLVSGSRDETLRLWQVGKKSHGELQAQSVLQGHEHWVTACAFSPVGDLVVSGSHDKTLRLWQVGSGSYGELSAQAILKGHEDMVAACVFSSSGDLLVSGSRDKTLRLWQVGRESSGELSAQAILRGHEGGVEACAFHPTGNLLVSAAGSRDYTLRLWEVGSASRGELSAQAILKGHGYNVTACAFSPQGDLLLSGSWDKTLRLWRVRSDSRGELSAQAILKGHETHVTACAFNPAGDMVVSGSRDKTLRLWDIRDIHHIICVRVVQWVCDVRSITLHRQNNVSRMVVGDEAGLLSVWEIGGGQLRFIGMSPQLGMTKVWRDTWKTTKLAGAQVTGPVKALLEHYRGAPLQEGVEENQVQLIADVPDVDAPLHRAPQAEQAPAESKQDPSHTPAAPKGKVGFFSRLMHRSPPPKAKVSAPPSGATTGGLFARFLPHRGPADQEIAQAHQHLGQAVLALLAAIETQRQPDWHPQAHIDFTAAVVSAFLKDENGKGFAQLCPPPRRIPMPASLCQFIETYLSDHPELRALHADIDFARHLKSKLLFKLDELYERFGVLDPAHAAASLGGGNAFE